MRAEVDGNERQPDDAGCIHRESDVLRLVEILGNFARLHRVHGAHGDQQHVVDERQQEPLVLHAAFQYHLVQSKQITATQCFMTILPTRMTSEIKNKQYRAGRSLVRIVGRGATATREMCLVRILS